jgi:hypothetical protein
MAEHTKHHGGPRHAHEFDRELNMKALVVFMIVIAAITVAAFWGMWIMGVGLKDHLAISDPPPYPITESADDLLPPLPRLQVQSYADWPALRDAQREQLETYAVTDGGAGKVRIPIEEAMRRAAEQGLPVFPALPADPADVTGN